ncbi:MAG TPA: glycosyltransferase, partial [Candidatus Methylacidiphilales bacterium]
RALLHPRPGRLGIFSSRAWGAREARAPLVGLLDSDDVWHPRFLERQEAVYRALFGERPGMVCGPAVYYWDDPVENLRSYVQPMPAPGLHEPPGVLEAFFDGSGPDDWYARSAANSATLIARQCLLDAAVLIGEAAEKTADDQFLWGHVGLRHPIVVNPEPLAWYRQWPGSTCATERKDTTAIRRNHLRWFLGHLDAFGGLSGEAKAPLRRRVEGWLRELDHPPGPLARKLRQWKAGLRRRLE